MYSESNISEVMQKLIQVIVDTENALICFTHVSSTSVISTYSCENLLRNLEVLVSILFYFCQVQK